jgi:cobaltochelatase CobN
MWNQIVDTYYKDKNNLGVDKFLENGNNDYAKISMSGTLLTAAYNGQWKASKADLQIVANSLAQMVVAHGVACCDCSCGNIAMLKWATQFVNPDMLAQFNQQLYSATQNSAFGATSQEPISSQESSAQGQTDQSSSSSTQGQTSSSAGPEDNTGKSTSDQASSDNGKAYEINPQNKQNSSSQTGMPIYAIIGVIVVVGLLGWGYFRSKPQ